MADSPSDGQASLRKSTCLSLSLSLSVCLISLSFHFPWVALSGQTINISTIFLCIQSLIFCFFFSVFWSNKTNQFPHHCKNKFIRLLKKKIETKKKKRQKFFFFLLPHGIQKNNDYRSIYTIYASSICFFSSVLNFSS